MVARSYLHGHKTPVKMELAVFVTIRQFLLYVNCASEFEAAGNSDVTPSEALLSVPNDELHTWIRLIGHQMLFNDKITLAVGVGDQIRATIRKVGKHVPLVVFRALSTVLLLHGFNLKTNSQMCGHIYIYIYIYILK